MGPLLKVSRTMDVRQTDITDAGIGAGAAAFEELAAIEGISIGLSTMEAQPVGVVGSAKNSSTVGGGAGNDALGVQATGRITGSGTGVGIGIASYGRKESTAAKISGAEIGSINNSGVADTHSGANFDASHGIWLIAGGNADSATGILIGRSTTGMQFDVGIGFISGNGGAVKTASIRDASVSETSLLIKGTHATAALAIGAGSGKALIGEETSNFTASLLEVIQASATDPLVVFGSLGNSAMSAQLIRNSSGQLKAGIASGANSFMPGSTQGDAMLQNPIASKRLLLGGTSANGATVPTIQIKTDGTLGFFGATEIAKPTGYSPTNVTTDRIFDANSTTIDELADVLGTLIADLKLYGLIGA
jgi:hypothetical protein